MFDDPKEILTIYHGNHVFQIQRGFDEYDEYVYGVIDAVLPVEAVFNTVAMNDN